MIKNVLNGDGLILGFYGILWLKLQEHKQQAFTFFTLPHTIIYTNQSPSQWFYSNPEGKIMRKKQTSLTRENILGTFVQSQDEICAYFITQQDDKSNILEYIKGSDLDDFLTKPYHKNGLLQQFVEPLGQYNFLIQIIWSSHLILFNKRTNINKMTNDKVPIHQRLATYDGNQALSIESCVTTKSLSVLLQKIALSISHHIENVSYGQHITQGMVMYVKIDQNSKVNLLYCTSARTNFSQEDTKKNLPITLHQNLIHNPTKYKNLPCFYTKSKAIKELECVNCNLRHDPQDMIQCQLSELIDHHERVCLNSTATQIEKPFKILMRKQKQNVPPIVLKLLPKITKSEYENKIVHIRVIKIYICGDCYLKNRSQEKEDYKHVSFKKQYQVNQRKFSQVVSKGLAIYRLNSQQDAMFKGDFNNFDEVQSTNASSQLKSTMIPHSFYYPTKQLSSSSSQNIFRNKSTNNSIQGGKQKSNQLSMIDIQSDLYQQLTTTPNSLDGGQSTIQKLY